MTDQQLFLFLAEVVVLFLAARIGGEIAARLHIPQHIGELGAGIILGPSVLGWIWPDAFDALFSVDPLQSSLLEILSWVGVIFLLILAGLETRLGLLRGARGAMIGGWIGGFGLPFLLGFLLGSRFPETLTSGTVERPVFALFVATAMSISAIPVIARILMDLRLYKTRMGVVILSAAMADDTVGWIVLSVVTGLATGGIASGAVVRTILLTGIFVGVALSAGRPAVKRAMEFSRNLKVSYAEVSMMLLLVLGMGAITQAIGVHLVLGAFLAAILIGRTRPTLEAQEGIRQIGLGFFIPFFFAYTGLKVDFTALHGSAWFFAALAVAAACVGKVVGGGVGTWLGGLPVWEAAGVGFGLNARGAMELVIAAIGLSAGILNAASYAIIVLIAILTTLMAAPMMKFCVQRAGPRVFDRPNHHGLRPRKE